MPFPYLLITLLAIASTYATMSSIKDAPPQLQPLLITLSALHLPPPISALHRLSGTEVFLPNSDTDASIIFKAIISEGTGQNLLLKSFYDSNVRGKTCDGTRYILSTLADQGISRCAFTTTYGMVAGQPLLNDKTAPQFKVDGMSRVPFMHQGYFFSPVFLICDHIFSRQEYETQFVAVLSLNFLREYFILAESRGMGWEIRLPPHSPTQISELPIYTDGCCLSNGLPLMGPPDEFTRGGYGIHFPTLPNGWDMYGALASSDSHTNHKAELTAIIRALQLVRLRNISCTSISVFTDSAYAVQALNDYIPNKWRSNGYRSSKNREVVNAALFQSLDQEVSLSEQRGIPVTLSYVPRDQNKKADALSKLGAAGKGSPTKLGNPSKESSKGAEVKATEKTDKRGMKGVQAEMNDCAVQDGRPQLLPPKDWFEKMKPLVQWTPDGVYWANCQSGDDPSGSLDFSLSALVV